MTRFWPLQWMPGRVHHPYETLIYLSYRRSAGLRHLNCNGSCGGLSKAGKRRGACHCAPLWPAFAAAQVGELIKSTKKQKSKKQNNTHTALLHTAHSSASVGFEMGMRDEPWMQALGPGQCVCVLDSLLLWGCVAGSALACVRLSAQTRWAWNRTPEVASARPVVDAQ